jgi:hypothetical protein
MASNGKKKTTMAKLNRENRLRERRMHKAAKKDARKRDAAERAAAGLPPAWAEETPPAAEEPTAD